MTTGGSGLEVAAEVRRGGFRVAVDVCVPSGEVLAVLGPNGAGKTTVLRALAGLNPVTSGRVVLDGRVLDDAAAEVFVEAADRPVGFVFQDYRLFPHLSARANVAFSPRARGLGRDASLRRADDWLDRLGLASLSGRKPADLSGGQAQRVALARALAGEPALLLLDEPLAALDARTRMDVQSELRRHLADFRGPCVLVTHDPLEALVLADRLLVLEDGAVVQLGSPAEVARRPATEYVAKLVGLNLYVGHADGAVVVLDGGGSFVVPDQHRHQDVLVALRPSAVVVSTSEPPPSSARNVWPGRVAGLTMLADRVRMDVEGVPAAVVDVTPAAVADLGLGPGTSVWLSVKATELEIYARTRT